MFIKERERETKRPRGKRVEIKFPFRGAVVCLRCSLAGSPVARRLSSIRRLKYPAVFLLLASGCIHHLQHFEIAWLVFACLLSNMSASSWSSFWWVFSIKNSNAVLQGVTCYFHDFAFFHFSVVCILLLRCLSWDIACILLLSVRLQMINIVTFTFMHLADAFIQSDSKHSGYTFFLSVCVFPGNWTHNLLRC